MATSTVNLSPDDVEIQPAATPSLSSDDVEVVGQPKASPASGSIDMSKVAGADPGMQSPEQAAGRANHQPVQSQTAIDAVLHQSPYITSTGKQLSPAGQVGEDLAPKPVTWHPIDAAEEMGHGIAETSRALAPAIAPAVGLRGKLDPDQKVDPNAAARGGTKIINSSMELGKPAMIAGIGTAPIKMAVGYVAGVMAGNGSAAVAQKMGLSPDEVEFIHTAAFFLPNVIADAMALKAGTGETTARVRGPGGEVNEVPVKAAAVTGRGFQGGVGKGEDGSIYAAGRVGPFSGRIKFGGTPEGKPGPAPEQGQLQAPPPDAVAAQRQEQVQKTAKIAADAQATNAAAAAKAGLQPEAPPPPKPGEPGSKELPKPAGLDDGVITQQTVENVGKAIQALPPELKGKGIIETTANFAKLVAEKGVIVGPDHKVSQVTGQSPQAKEQSARSIATKLVNDEVERQNQVAQQAAESQKAEQEEQAKQAEENAKTAQEEKEAALEGTTETSTAKKTEATAPVVEIPNTRQVQQARGALKSAPKNSTAEQLEKIVRESAMVTTPVRKQLVQEEIRRRANAEEQAAETAMNGKGPEPGQDRESLQAHTDKVAKGEHPYVFVPKGSSFKPNAEGLLTTKINGAGDLSGTYFHAKDIKSAELRDAVRQGTLGDLIEKWKNAHPAELGDDDVEQVAGKNVQTVENPTSDADRIQQAETLLRQHAPNTLDAMREDRASEEWSDKEYAQHLDELIKDKGLKPEEKPAEPETKPAEAETEKPKADTKPVKKPVTPQIEAPAGSTPLGAKPAPKVGDKVKFANSPGGKEREGVIKAFAPNGTPMVQPEGGGRIPVPLKNIKPVASPQETEDNTNHGDDQPASASLDRTAGGRPSSDSGSGDRGDLAPAQAEVSDGSRENGNAEGSDQGDSAELHPNPESVPEQGTEPGSGPGSDTGLDKSPAKSVVDKAKKQAAKPVLLNKDWFTHPDNWQVPGGEVTRLEGNMKALRILRDVEKNPRKLTEEERQTLANYVGWGALAKVFDPYQADFNEQRKWREARQELENLLSPEEFEAARRSTTNAHYTSPEIVRFMWDIAQRFGLKAGNILEPSMGVGNFFGMMPKSIRGKVTAIGNELDPVTYGIAKLLYPSATLFNKDFKDLIIPDNEIDFAIGNVPFGDWSIYDPKYPKLKALIHDYFMVKSLDKVRPGGIVAFITSTGTMDKANSTIRNILASKADLVGAFRLPSTAFKANAGTSVTTDLIILQKRALGQEPGGEAWLESPLLAVNKDDGSGTHDLTVNEYYQKNYDNMLGKPVASTRMYGSLNFMLQPYDDPMPDILKRALSRLPKGLMLDQESRATGLDQASTAAQYAPDNILERQYVLDDKGNLKQRIEGKLVAPAVAENKDGTLNPAKIVRMKEMVGLRGSLNRLLEAMVTLPDDEDSNKRIGYLRSALAQDYNKFVKKFGLLNSPTNRVFQDDPHFPRLLALEHYDRAARTGTQADIFRRRTIFPREPLKSISPEPKEALQQILAERGFPDVATMGRLLGRDPKEVAAELVKQGLIFRDPEVGDYQTREKYLSGYVRDKLRSAEAAVAQGMTEYEPNVAALTKVIPADIEIGDDPATSVSVRLGSTWIPIPAIEEFFRDTFRTPGVIKSAQGNWNVSLGGRMTPELTTTWGSPRVTGENLLEDCLNQKQTTVYDRNSDGTSTLNKEQTTIAQAAQEKIRNEFQRWAAHSRWKPALQTAYNQAYNNLVSTEYDGSHLTFPGMNQSIVLKPHQVNAVWRILQDGRGLLAHEVGAGKTFEMAAAIMEGRRVGTFKKPMLTVPNHIVEQFRKEFLLLYPGANLLVPTEDDFDSRNRQRIMSHIATGDYDAIILPHSQFNLMDISPERQAITLEREMDELEETIRALRSQRGADNKRIVKQLEKAKEKRRTALARLKDLKADRAINFDDTGVDALFVDEAHNYKNLSFYTKMTRVAGLQQAQAKSATRLKMKTEFLQDTRNNRGVIFATGTPVQNTMAELYTMIKYVAPDVLEHAGIRFFDDWAANFGATITAMELSADGRSYKARTKFARFQNVPELMQMFRSFADIKTAADLDLPRPSLESGKPIIVTVPGSDALESFVQNLMKRAEKVRGGGVDPKHDNMLKITTDGRKAATDMRLIDPTFDDDAHSKINTVVNRMLREWEEGKEGKLTQMAFLDLYRTTDDADHELLNLYNDMRNKLVASGVPRDEVAVVGEHDTRIKRQALFDKVNKGIVRILFGSTQKMGAGTNAQVRLKTLHHIDLTWRPGDLAQRDGRILRQGNTNPEVRILTYLTEKSFDAYMAQVLQGKAEFISQVFSGKSKARVMVDAAADMVLSLEEMKIAASGNPDVKLKYDLEMKAMQLHSIERAFETQKRQAHYDAQNAEMKAAAARGRAKAYGDALAKYEVVKGEDGKGFSLKVDGKTFTDRKSGFEYLKSMEVPDQNFWLDFNGVGASVRVAKESGEPDFRYEMAYGSDGHPTDRTMEALGNSIEARLRNLPEWVDKAKREIANAESDAARYEELSKRTDFPEKPELDKVLKDLKEVEGRLGLGNINAGSQAGADAVTADAEDETPDLEPKEQEEEDEETSLDRTGSDSVFDALGSEEGSATVPPIFEKAGEYIGKAAAVTLKDALKSAGVAGKGMKEIGREVVAHLYPRALMSEEMKDILGRAVGTPAFTQYKASQLMDGVQKMFKAMPAADQVAFVDRYEHGQRQSNEELQQAAELMRSIIEEQEAEEHVAANLGRKPSQRISLPKRENYFPHRYKTPPGSQPNPTDDERILKMAGSRGPLEGTKQFLKQQKMTLAEAVGQGAETLGTPVDMLMKRLQEGAKFIAAKYTMHSGKEAGLVRFLKKGRPMPDGFTKVDDKMMKVWRPIESEDGKTFVTQTGEWVWQKDFGRGLNNYLSKDHIRGSKTGTAIIKLKNATTEARLSWSGFHFAYITVENFASGVNIGLDKLYNGGLRNLDGAKAIEGLAEVGKSIISPFTAVKTGGRMIQYAKNPDEFLQSKEGQQFVDQYPDFAHLQKLLFHGGLRWNLADNFRQSLGDDFAKQIKEGHLGTATLKFFPWLSHLMMKPLFEHYIPRAKWSFAVQMLAHKLNQYSDALAAGEVTEDQLARQVASAADYRFGELNFDNFYWNNTFRTANQIMFRSASWKAGSWMGAAKAVHETVEGLKGTFKSSGFNDHIYDTIDDQAKGWKERARRFTSRLPEMGINAGWLMSMGLVTAVMASVMTYLATKTPLWEHAEEDHEKNKMSYLGALAFEAMHPRTGKKDPHGEPIRFSFPTGLKDYEHAYHNPAGYVRGSLSDVAANAIDTMENRDAFQNYVFNPNDPGYQKFLQSLEYNAKGDFLPMSLSNYRDSYGPQDATSKLERATGLVGGSPKEYDRSAALNLALKLRTARGPETPEQEEAYQMTKEHPTAHDVRKAIKEGKSDYLEHLFKGLTYADAKRVYDEGTPEEQRELKPLLKKKQINAIKKARER